MRLRLLPTSLAGRFALASAGMAAAAVLLVALLSWWLIEREHALAEVQFAARERQFHAANVGSFLRAVSSRMNEIASSTILATGLVDSAGKETYLTPFLDGVRQVNGIPVQLLFTDYEGQEIAANASARFDAAQRGWLKRQLAFGVPAADLFTGPDGPELVAMAPLRYSRTNSAEGAVLYKIVLRDIALESGLSLKWGPEKETAGDSEAFVDAPPVFAPLQFRLVGRTAAGTWAGATALLPQFLIMGLLAAFAFLALYVAGRRLGHLLMRDLMRLEAFSSKVLSAQWSQQRAPTGGSREVASLAQSINHMLDRLLQQHDHLKREGNKLTELAVALQLADRRKDEFLAMLAHELRNPLAPISTGAQLLRAFPGADDRVRRTSEIISRQVRHMTKIVDDLLDVSRVTRGLVTLEKVPLELAGVLSAAVDQVQPGMEARRHRLELQLTAEPLVVAGDAARLVQVVSNLLQNACKYTPDGGHVVLSMRKEEKAALVEVADNGSGIAPELMPDIFGLFTQGSRSSDRSQGGLGLGLPLVKNLVELHGGSVLVHSAGVGHGTTVAVRLPLSTALPAITSGRTPLANAKRLSLMVVDDNVDAAQTLASVLEMEGHQVTVAFDGLAALEQAAEKIYDAFILDIGLPGMDGVELAQRLRARTDGMQPMLIALSGYGQQADRERTRAAGFDHHLVKPTDPAFLHQCLHACKAV